MPSLTPDMRQLLTERIAVLDARYGPPPFPLTCFVCREPILETFFAYPCCDECLEALLLAHGIGFDDRRRLTVEWGLRQESW